MTDEEKVFARVGIGADAHEVRRMIIRLQDNTRIWANILNPHYSEMADLCKKLYSDMGLVVDELKALEELSGYKVNRGEDNDDGRH